MNSTRLKFRGSPETVGCGFVLGVIVGTFIGNSLTFMAAFGLCGAVMVPLVRRHVSISALADLCRNKIRAIGAAADISLP